MTSDGLLGRDHRLFVYGSLAPGERHSDELAGLRGVWRPARVGGWIEHEGEYPVFWVDAEGPWQEVLLFESEALAGHWERLDAFEGEEYRRVVVEGDCDGVVVLGQIYVASEGTPP